MRAEITPSDQSVVSPRAAGKSYSKIIVLPPPGSSRGSFEPKLVLFEREFLRRGLTVISPAVTGRAVVPPGKDTAERKPESPGTLSDLERALIMAKGTGAEIVLQLSTFIWLPGGPTRFFVTTTGRQGAFQEVDAVQHKAWRGPAVRFNSPVLHFVGKLIDVDTGEVLSTLAVQLPANGALPEDYVARYKVSGTEAKLIPGSEEHFAYELASRERIRAAVEWIYTYPWQDDARGRAEDLLVGYVADKIRASGRKP